MQRTSRPPRARSAVHLRSRRAGRARRGGALLAALMLVIIVAGMGVVVVQLHAAQTRRQVQAIDDKRALYIAEAGLAEAFLAVSLGKSGSVGTADAPAAFGDGVFWVEATDVGEDQVSLRSTGLCGVGRFCVQVTLQRQTDPLASLGVFSHVDLLVGEGAIVDGYDSRDRPFDGDLDPSLPIVSTGAGGMLASNADLVLEGEAAAGEGLLPGLLELPAGLGGAVTYVFGDARPGPAGAVSAESGVLITGSTTPAAVAVGLPVVEAPKEGKQARLKWNKSAELIKKGRYLEAEVTVPAGCELTLVGPLSLTAKEFVLGPGASLVCDTADGQVDLYVTDYLAVQPGAEIVNTTEDTTRLALLVGASEWLDRDEDGLADPPVVFEPGGEFHGFLYAPGADLTIPASVRYYGGVAADGVTIAPGAHVSFDRALASSELTFSALPKLVAWRVVELPRTEIVSLRVDPLRKLLLEGKSPEKSSVAHVDGYLKIEYFDAAGTLQVFVGEAKDFDWGQVKKAVKTVWDDDATVDDV